MVEIFNDRIEIKNPGLPIIDIKRFVDAQNSRNIQLANILRKWGFCEEIGMGIDGVVLSCEIYQLPAPVFKTNGNTTTVILYAPKKLNYMNKKEKIWATYLHACIKAVSNEFLTNQSIRKRFEIDKEQSYKASRIIKYTLDAKLIKNHPEYINSKSASYIPFWFQNQ